MSLSAVPPPAAMIAARDDRPRIPLMGPFTEKAVLIVDHDRTTRVCIGEVLREIGVTVAKASGGADALNKLREIRFDLIAMDICLPSESGLDAVQAIQMADPRCRMLAVTGCNYPRDPELARLGTWIWHARSLR